MGLLRWIQKFDERAEQARERYAAEQDASGNYSCVCGHRLNYHKKDGACFSGGGHLMCDCMQYIKALTPAAKPVKMRAKVAKNSHGG